MDAKEYLTQLKNLDDLLSVLREELDNAELMASSMRSVMSNTPSSTTGKVSDPTAASAINLTELRAEIKTQLDKFIQIKITAIRLMNKMSDVRYMTVLYHYYIHNRTLEGTAGQMNRSYQNVCMLHKYALAEFQKLMDLHGIDGNTQINGEEFNNGGTTHVFQEDHGK